MSLTLAAVGAVVAALIQSTLVPYLEIAGARPDLIVIVLAIITVVIGVDHGLAVAFVGGLTIDILAPRPLGSTAFVLLVVVGAAAGIGRLVPRARGLSTVAAVLLASLLSPLLFLVVYGALRGPIPVDEPLASIVPDAVYNTLIALLACPLAVYAHARYFEKDRINW